MGLLQQSRGDYALIKSEFEATDIDITIEEVEPRISRRRTHRLLLFLLTAGVCFALGFATSLLAGSGTQGPQIDVQLSCKAPTTRREWRTLNSVEKQDYIRAVQCLKTVPSRLVANQTLYDDFPWVHALIGGYSHKSAAFLAWHRYFIHVYEQALQQECGYHGHLPYWDWGLDWQDITKSPIWDGDSGFGGDGNAAAGDPSNIDPDFTGYCLDNGPFAGLEVLYVGPDYKPHCLARKFRNSTEVQKTGNPFEPEALGELLQRADYESFNLGLEDGPHLSLPLSVQGDFLFFTAPNDPVFFLHHAQLDRMWWMWQQADLERRGREYLGLAASNSTAQASLTDTIPMGGLAVDIKVMDIMSTTEGEMLCYRY